LEIPVPPDEWKEDAKKNPDGKPLLALVFPNDSLQKFAERIITTAVTVRDMYHHPNAIHGNNKIAKGVIFYEEAFSKKVLDESTI
jgi:hypothetical protein